ncbi:hypothetical protein BKG82_26495 [Mycobacteroides chelonae]|uniref:Uncharacterized protein n=1 Tax=Mycobacteroides chelonae TaxID=1774 RepID=A0A1S1LCR6_MYCCH|nr:hypothetical protein [Mycobacteroides chelonae]OHU47208.1 hypothetical protein BKG82_26495 [Mycobacteroides chelonae]
MTLLASLFVDHADTIRFLADITEHDDGGNGSLWTLGKRVAAVALVATVVGFIVRVAVHYISVEDPAAKRDWVGAMKNFAFAISLELGAYSIASIAETVQTGVFNIW